MKKILPIAGTVAIITVIIGIITAHRRKSAGRSASYASVKV